MSDKKISISLFWQNKNKFYHKKIFVSAGSSAEDVLNKAKIFADFDFDNFADLAIGVFSNRVNLSYIMQEGDRLEIYQPLFVTPAQARALRAEKIAKDNLAKK